MQQETLGTLIDPETRKFPYPFYDKLRDQAPVYPMPGGDFYFVSRYDLALKILQDPVNYSNEFIEGESSFVNFLPEADALLAEKGYGRRVKTVVFSDPPLHTKFRRMLSESFRPSAIKAMEPNVRKVMADLLADMKEDGVYDVVQTLLVPLPMFVLANWFGVDQTHYLDFKRWSNAANYTLQPPQPREVLLTYAETIAEMQHYLAGLMEERRREPRQDLISDLLKAELPGERPLTDKEILSLLETLLVAGNETTTNAIGNGVLILAQDQALQADLRADIGLVPKFVEEVLRSESSVTGVWRRTKNEVELAGVTIAPGSKILVGLAAANRDEDQFPHANAVDYSRANIRGHVAFGSGFHTCLGNQLARIEMLAFFEMFLKEFSSIELAVPADEVQWMELMGLRGLKELPLRLTR